jgi:excisionase family DNA binding protein
MAVMATTQEAAKILGVTEETIRRRISRGHLKATKVTFGNRHRWLIAIPIEVLLGDRLSTGESVENAASEPVVSSPAGDVDALIPNSAVSAEPDGDSWLRRLLVALRHVLPVQVITSIIGRILDLLRASPIREVLTRAEILAAIRSELAEFLRIDVTQPGSSRAS